MLENKASFASVIFFTLFLNLLFQSAYSSQSYGVHFYRSLADMDADGRINQHEFAVALHLIQMKLKGIELPATLPASLRSPTTFPTANFAAAFGPPLGAHYFWSMYYDYCTCRSILHGWNSSMALHCSLCCWQHVDLSCKSKAPEF